MDQTEIDKGFLYIVGTQVLVTGTKHHGFRGVVTDRPINWSARSIAVILDEWPEIIWRFYRHNLIPEWQLP